MNKVQIVVDSTVDLNKEHYEQYGLHVVPLNVNFGEENYRDGVDITPDEVYERVKKDGKLPSTAAISPALFAEEIKSFIDKGMDVVFVGIGSKLSTTFQNLHIACADFSDHVFPIDSNSLSTGSGLLALKCAKLRDEGKSAKEIQEAVQPLADKLSVKFVLDRLEYMRKGGRCSTFAAIFGTLLRIHPILKMSEGKLIMSKKVRGPIKLAYNDMINELKGDMPNVDLDHVMITHAGMNDEDLKYLYDEVAKVVDKSRIMVTRAGCVISSHCGYGCVGILYIKK